MKPVSLLPDAFASRGASQPRRIRVGHAAAKGAAMLVRGSRSSSRLASCWPGNLDFRIGHARALLTGLLCAVVAVGCASFRPKPIQEIPFRERAKTEDRDGLRITVAVPGRDEAESAFGVDLYGEGIQPVWLSIENETDVPFWFMLHGLDPNYFSSREAAYKSHFTWRPATNRRVDDHFEDLGIVPAVPPHGKTSGFAFSNVKLGTKEVRVRLLSEKRVEDFHFYVSVPGFRADWHDVDWEKIKADQEVVNLETDEELLAALETLPCCTTRKNGTGKGDPLNLVVISKKGGLTAFVRAGWDETELLTFGSAWRTFKASFGGEYKYSPMSALYVFGRPQDIGLQKARDTIHERNHLRLWATPWRYQGRIVWVGAITRDIGVYFTTRAWNLTTHAIDPHVDEARTYLIEDLATAEVVEKFGPVGGVGAATRENPHRNLMHAPYWTDGERVVFLLADEPVPLDEMGYFGWYKFGEHIRALEGVSFEAGATSESDLPQAEPPADAGREEENGGPPEP